MRLSDRYELLRRVGEGGGGGVFLVRDRLADDAEMVLKRLHANAQAGVAQWLVNEFQIVAQLGLPTVASVYDFGLAEPDANDPGGPFFTRAFVDGAPLDVSLGPPATLDVDRLVRLFVTAAETLAALHRLGVVHGDLKPANLIVPSHGRHVILIDFGLAHGALGAAERVRGGTLAFLPPERRDALFAGDSLAPDPRADVYALAATLLAVLGVTDVEAPEPPSLRANPRLHALWSVAHRGTNPEPEGRFATAEDFLVALCGGRAQARTIPNRIVLRPEGRESELGTLLESVARRLLRRDGGAGSILLVGEEGSGRSTLARELTWRAQLRGVQVLSVQGAPGGGPMARLRAGAAILSGAPLDAEHDEAVVSAFRRASSRSPVLVIADDVDRCDPAVVGLLRSLGNAGESNEGLLLVATAASDASATALASQARVSLGPLDDAAVAALCAQILGPTEPGVAHAVRAKAGGVPLAVREVLAGLAASGGATTADVEALQLPTRARDVAARRVASLSAEERDAAAVVAVLGAHATHARLLRMGAAPDALERARIDGVLVARADGRLEVSQSALGDALVESLTPDARAALFQRAADTLAVTNAGPVPTASAWVRAGDATRAKSLLDAAVSDLRTQGLPLAAAGLVASVRAIEPTSDTPAMRFTEADLRLIGGDLTEAARLAEAAIDGETDASETAQSARLLCGRARAQLGQNDRSAAVLRAGLERATDPNAAGRFQREIANVELRAGEFGECARRCESALAGVTDAGVGAALLALAGLSVSYLGDQLKATGLLDRALARFQETGDTREEARVLAYLAIAKDRMGDRAAARSLGERALERARAAGDVAQMASARLNLGAMLDRSGDLSGAVEHFEAAARLAQRAGKPDTSLAARLNTAQILIAIGSHTRALAEAETALASARAHGFREMAAHATALVGLARARHGEVEPGLGLIAEATERFTAMAQPNTVAEMAFIVAELLLDRGAPGDVERASERLTAARQAVADLGPRAARALMLEGRVASVRGDARGAIRTLTEAVEIAERANDWETQSLALAARAHAHQSTGAEIHARRDRERALEILEAAAATLPPDLRSAFWSVPDRAALRVEGSSNVAADGRASVNFAGQGMGLTGAPPTLIANDQRLMLLLDLSRRVGEETSLERVLEQAVRSAVELTNAERGAILLPSESGALEVRARAQSAVGDGPDEAFSRSIAETVWIDGEVVATHNARGDSRFADFRSVHELSIGAVAAVPIRARGRTLGVLYVENRLRRGVWKPSDVALIKAFAEQAAIAVDHARLIGELEARSQQLERAKQEIEMLLADRTTELEATRSSLVRAQEALQSRFTLQGVVGQTPAMRSVAAVIERVRDADVPVVIEGESGTGKEMVARAVHHGGARAKGPFVVVHCGAIPETLLESELFGHVRGAFTGADRDRKGLIASASGGTLMLDEVADMSPKMQVELLRVIQDRTVRRVGSEQDERVDLRLVAATNRPLKDLVAEGKFREDLYYRLSVVTVRLPPLRERLDDIPSLANHFLARFAEEQNLPRMRLSREALGVLMRARWPGNVRQLRHTLESAAVLADGDLIEPSMLRVETPGSIPPPIASPADSPRAKPASPRAARKAAERQRIVEALEQANWNKVRAADVLKMPRRTLYRRLKEFGLLE